MRARVILGYSELMDVTMQAIQDYLRGIKIIGDRDGFWHGASGKNRANNASICLAMTPMTDHAAILVILLAVCGEVCKLSAGRSSRLAGLIADRIITGEHTVGRNLYTDTLDSKLISHRAFTDAKNDLANLRSPGPIGYFDKTRAIRVILREALSSDFKPLEQLDITESARQLEFELTKNTKQTAQNVFSQVINRNQAIRNSYKIGATIGAFNQAFGQCRQPKEVARIIGSFLSIVDAAKLVQTNRAAKQLAENEADKMRNRWQSKNKRQ